jgi:hypothetical protein
MYKELDSPYSDLRPGGARPVDEGNAADQKGTGSRAALICSIPLIHRGVPRQVARRAWSVSVRVCLWPSDFSRWSAISNDVTNHKAAGRHATAPQHETSAFFIRLRCVRSFVLI